MTTIERGPRATDRFAIIANDALADERLSYRARGVLGYLLSRPPGWRTTSDALSTQGREGRDAIRTALKELEAHGYLVRSKSRNDAGQWVHSAHVYDVPRAGEPAPENPAPENPAPEEPSLSNKTEGTKTEVSKTETSTVALRDDVERLCQRLADRIQANGSKRPTITQGWRDAARLMLDRDGRTEAQVAAIIDWSQADPFWQANVLSMVKLRTQFDALRLRSQANGASSARAARDRTAFGEDWADGTAVAEWEAVAGRPGR